MTDEQKEPVIIMPIYGAGGWVLHPQFGQLIFSGESAARWFFDAETRARIVLKDPSAFIRRGRTLATANPGGLMRATVAVMQENTAARVLHVAGEDPASLGSKTRVSALRTKRDTQQA